MKSLKYFHIFLFLFLYNSPSFAAQKIADPKESDTKIILKNNAYILLPLTIVGFSQWNWGNPQFHSKNEGFFQENSRYGGADKMGHFYSSYLVANLLSKKFHSDGIERDKAAFFGSLSAFTITTLIEIGDATAPEHGFSNQDQVMNILGSLSSYILLSNPSLNKKVAFKIDYIPTSNPFRSDGRLLDDYDGARYIASLKLSGFDFAKNNMLRFIELQASYRATGYISHEASKSRDVGIGIALNINEIINYFSDNKTNKYVNGFFEYYQPRYTYVTYDKDLNR